MYKTQLKISKIILLLATATIFIACNSKKQDVVFVKENPINENATKTYLQDVKNYKTDKNTEINFIYSKN